MNDVTNMKKMIAAMEAIEQINESDSDDHRYYKGKLNDGGFTQRRYDWLMESAAKLKEIEDIIDDIGANTLNFWGYQENPLISPAGDASSAVWDLAYKFKEAAKIDKDTIEQEPNRLNRSK